MGEEGIVQRLAAGARGTEGDAGSAKAAEVRRTERNPADEEAAEVRGAERERRGRRPAVSVVMPFAGPPAAAREALRSLRSLELAPGDELILVDNGGELTALAGGDVVLEGGWPERRWAEGGESLPAEAGAGARVLPADAATGAPPAEAATGAPPAEAAAGAPPAEAAAGAPPAEAAAGAPPADAAAGAVDAVDAPAPGGTRHPHPVRLLGAHGERSPAHARNAGAAAAANAWILFLDADTVPRPGLLDAFFAGGVNERVGALAGEILPAAPSGGLAARYSAARNFLGQREHFAHPYRPRAAAANLLVRREAFEQLGGFCEGVRAAEDTDFSWRLQEAGWRLELRPRATVSQLRRQWRGYAAGRAWLARRHRGFRPEPAAARALRRLRRGGPRRRPRRAANPPAANPPAANRLAANPLAANPPAANPLAVSPLAANPPAAGRTAPGGWERGSFLGLDVLLGLEELAGLLLSNRPRPRPRGRGALASGSAHARPAAPEVVLIAERFPQRGDPLVELAVRVGRVRVEALARPLEPAPDARAVPVDYLEDDGVVERWGAFLALLLRHPLRAALDLLAHASEPPLWVLAPAVARLARDRGARVMALHDAAVAQRLARLAGRRLDR